jgi:hypothetical protein
MAPNPGGFPHVSLWSARRTGGLGFGQDGRPQQRVQRAQGYQIDSVAEQVGQFVGELFDLPPNRRPGRNVQRMSMSLRWRAAMNPNLLGYRTQGGSRMMAV